MYQQQLKANNKGNAVGKIVNAVEHLPSVSKHITDAGAGVTFILSWIGVLTPILNFFAILLAVVWGVYRIIDIRLSNDIKREKLKDNQGS